MAASQKILIVRVGRGGDLVMITPALRTLLAAFPEAEIHLLTSADGPRILGDFDPRLTQMWRYHRRFPGRLLLERALRRQLLAQGYARAYTFETKPFYRRWLADVAPQFHGLTTGAAGHFCQRCMDLVEQSLDAPIVRGWAELPVHPDGVARARELLASHGIGGRTRLVGLHPTFSGTLMPYFRNRQGLRHRT